MRKPIAVQRRDYLASTGPSIFGIKRMEKVISPKGEMFIFLGVKEGSVYLERENKAAGEPFEVVETSQFSNWQKAGV